MPGHLRRTGSHSQWFGVCGAHADVARPVGGAEFSRAGGRAESGTLPDQPELAETVLPPRMNP